MPDTLVWDRQSELHAGGGPPIADYAGFCGQLKVACAFCQARDPQAEGAVEPLQGYAETNFEPGGVFANELDFRISSTPGSSGSTAGRTKRWVPGQPIASPTDWR